MLESRIKSLLKTNNKKIKDLCSYINITDAGLRKIFARDSCEVSTLVKIAEFFDVEPSVFFETSHMDEPRIEVPMHEFGFLPLIPIDAVAGFNGVDFPGVRLEDCYHYYVPEFETAKADFLIRVSGSSMYPKYSSGDLLACRKVQEVTFIQWGKIYVIDSQQGAMVKRLFEIEGDEQNLLCKSDNDKYPPFKLPKSEIRSLSIVVGVIRME